MCEFKMEFYLKKNRLKKPFVITFRLILILSVLRFSLAL